MLLISITSFPSGFHLNRIQNEETYSTLIISRLTQLFFPLISRKNHSPASELNRIVSARQETIWSHKRVLAFVLVKSHAWRSRAVVNGYGAEADGAKSRIEMGRRGSKAGLAIDSSAFYQPALEYIAGRWRESLTSTIVPFHGAINQVEGK